MGRRSDGPGSLCSGVGCFWKGEDTQAGSDLTWFSWYSPPLQSSVAAPSPVMGSMAPNDAMAAGPMAPGFFQVQPGLVPPVLQLLSGYVRVTGAGTDGVGGLMWGEALAGWNWVGGWSVRGFLHLGFGVASGGGAA